GLRADRKRDRPDGHPGLWRPRHPGPHLRDDHGVGLGDRRRVPVPSQLHGRAAALLRSRTSALLACSPARGGRMPPRRSRMFPPPRHRAHASMPSRDTWEPMSEKPYALLDSLTDHARRTFSAQACSIMLHEPETRSLVFAAMSGEGSEQFVGAE